MQAINIFFCIYNEDSWKPLTKKLFFFFFFFSLYDNQICHTDLHFIAHDVGQHSYPLVPGHEIIGVVTKVGSKATDFKIGDIVGVGCMVESCLSCSACANDEEQYCKNTPTWTYGADTRHSLHGKNQVQTIGGYSDKFVVDHRFAVKFPFAKEDFESEGEFNEVLAKCAPLLCAGITMYSPCKKYIDVVKKVRDAQSLPSETPVKVGVRGLGGLGQMGIKILSTMNVEVFAISHSPNKEEEAKRIGANHFVLSSSITAMNKLKRDHALDIILDTVGALPSEEDASPSTPEGGSPTSREDKRDKTPSPQEFYDVAADALATHGHYVLIGLSTKSVAITGTKFIWNDISLHGSLIGGVKQTKETVDFCWKHKIFPDVNIISVRDIPNVLQLLEKGNDSTKRYVIDASTFE